MFDKPITAAPENDLATLTSRIISAYVGKNDVPASEIPNLIQTVHTALSSAATSTKTRAAQTPAVPPAKSVTDDYIICLEDGKKFKSLKRHLKVSYGMTPEEYRQKWNLSPTYPMVSRNYAAVRSTLAKQTGLGRRPRSKD